ncbi:hypothetical protein [Methylophaga sp.]|uniref:hypothetical protein n=1 Tax=Methylophaga sp. TaxID=2024840 RepID=UPI003F6A12B9
MEWVFLLVFITGIALFVFVRKQKQVPPEHEVHKMNYAAVRIKPHQHACDAAFDCSHRVFLVAEAPLLPLPDCTKSESCRCGYVHYDDRRSSGLQRRGESIVMRDVFDKRERRDEERRGRRATD